MCRFRKHFNKGGNQHGAAAIFVVVCMTLLIGFAALAIDVGYLYATRNELQNVADAAALAGAGFLGSTYKDLSYSEQQNYMCNRGNVVAAVQQVAQKNHAAGKNINILDNASDIVIGTWNGSSVDSTIYSPNAVRVTARRDDSANGPISSFFARIFDIETMDVTASATAALTGPAYVDKGELKTPFGLSQNVFPNNCTDPIIFSPTTESCAGWHNFIFPSNSNSMEETMLGIIRSDNSDCSTCGGLSSGETWLNANFDMSKLPDSVEVPKTQTGDAFNFQGGTIASMFLGGVLDTDYNGNIGSVLDDMKHPAPFPALFDYFRYRDGDGEDTEWTAFVPVYADGITCENPNKSIPIVGFATIVIKMPNPPPDSSVSVWIDCNQSIVEGRGGGATFGNLKGSIPNLVE